MKKRYIFIIILLIVLMYALVHFFKNNQITYERTLNNIQKVDEYISQLIDANIRHVKNSKSRFTWEKERNNNKWSYYDGLMMLAFLKTGKFVFVDNYYNSILRNNGTVDNSINPSNKIYPYDVDSVPAARPLIYMSESKYFKKYKLTLEDMYKRLHGHPTIGDCGENLYHKALNQGWQKYPLALDGIYMALPFILDYEANAKELNLKYKDKNSQEVIFKRMNWVSENMKNKIGIYDHVISDKTQKTNGISWLRAIGWYSMAQVDLLDNIEEGKNKQIMKKQLKMFFDNMLKKQNPYNGMWKNVVYSHGKNKIANLFDYGHNCNYYETSGSAMMAYSLMKAYTKGYVGDKKYAYAGLKAFNGIVENNMVEVYGDLVLANIYRSTGASDDIGYYQSCTGYLNDEAKGVGPVILASVEAKKLLKMLK